MLHSIPLAKDLVSDCVHLTSAVRVWYISTKEILSVWIDGKDGYLAHPMDGLELLLVADAHIPRIVFPFLSSHLEQMSNAVPCGF